MHLKETVSAKKNSCHKHKLMINMCSMLRLTDTEHDSYLRGCTALVILLLCSCFFFFLMKCQLHVSLICQQLHHTAQKITYSGNEVQCRGTVGSHSSSTMNRAGYFWKLIRRNPWFRFLTAQPDTTCIILAVVIK